MIVHVILSFCWLTFYWSIVDLQCCVSFCCTAKWISYTYTYIHSFLDSFIDLTYSGRQEGREIRWKEEKNFKESGTQEIFRKLLLHFLMVHFFKFFLPLISSFNCIVFQQAFYVSLECIGSFNFWWPSILSGFFWHSPCEFENKAHFLFSL